MKRSFSPVQWEAAWAPYDEDTYALALDMLWRDDVVLDIGAGDLRFARRAARRARAVIALEQRAELLTQDVPPFAAALTGWYACQCGATGFRATAVEAINPESLACISEVVQCPQCGARERIDETIR